MSASRERSALLLVGGLGGGLFILLAYLADLIAGNVMYQPDAGPLVALGLGGCLAVAALAFSPIGRSIARRFDAEATLGGGEFEELRDMMLGMQHQLAEVQERLDFTERLLARGRAPDQLPRG